MRKRTQLTQPIAQQYIGSPISSTTKTSWIRISNPENATVIPMTLQQIRRFFHFGHAFNLRQLKYFEFDSSFVIGSVDAPDFFRSIKRVKELLNHTETHKLCDKILATFTDEKTEYIIGVRVEQR